MSSKKLPKWRENTGIRWQIAFDASFGRRFCFLVSKEREIVNETLLQNPACLNLKVGGTGMTSEDMKNMWKREGHREKIAISASAQMKRQWHDPTTREKMLLSRKKAWENPSEKLLASHAIRSAQARSKPVEIDGIRYPSLAAASRILGITQYRLTKDPTFNRIS